MNTKMKPKLTYSCGYGPIVDLSDQQIREIIDSYGSNSARAISEMMGLERGVVSAVITKARKTYNL